MATNLTIPPLTVPAGQTIFGPATPGAGLQGLILTLDIAALTPSMDVRIEHSEDAGATWRLMAETVADGPATVKGVLQPLRLEANLGTVGDAPLVTTATSRVRAVVNNTTAFASSGGTLATY